MKRLSFALAALALCAAAFALADALRTQIAARNGAIHKAVLDRDIEAYKTAVKIDLADGFKCVYKGKEVTFEEMVSQMSQILDDIPQILTEEVILLSLVKKGDTATATTEHKIRGFATDDEGLTQRRAFYGTSVETYRLTDGKWVLAKQLWRTRQMEGVRN